MLMLLRRLAKREEGFTLIELMVVVIIIGILIAILIPNFFGRVDEAKEGRVKADLNSIATAAQMYKIDHEQNYWPEALDDLETYGIDSSAADPWGGGYEIVSGGDSDEFEVHNTTNDHQYTLTIDANGKKTISEP